MNLTKEKTYEFLIELLMHDQGRDILQLASVAEEIMKKGQKEDFKKKLAFVQKCHRKSDGSIRSIIHVQRGEKTYYFTRLEKGKQITAKSQAELIEKLYLFYSQGMEPEDYSIGRAWKLYISEFETLNPTKGKTLRDMKADYKRFITEEFSKTDVKNLTAKDVEIYIQKFILEKGLKRKAFLSFKSTLNKIFDTAVYQGWISFNPAKHVRNKRLMEMCDQSLAARETEDVLLSNEELQAVFAEVKRRKDLPRNKGYYYFDGMIRLHALLGCRPAELCSLKWVDVKGMDGKDAKASPALHIHAQIKAILDEMKQMQKASGVESEYIFCHKDGHFVNPEAYAEFIHSVFQAAGIKGKTSYVFRRGVNQLLDERGVSPTNRAKLLGHTVQTNLSCYTFANRDVVEIGRKALESVMK